MTTPSPAENTAAIGRLVAAARATAAAFGADAAEVPPVVPGYELTTPLGRGGQAVVWAGRHRTTGRAVAIKVAHRVADDPSAQAGFRREVQVLAGLQHPALVTVFDSGRTGCGRPFFVMDHVRGERFDAWVVDQGRALRPVVAMVARIAAAVHRAHQAGVVHRDLKPSNLRVDEHGDPRVLDFGLAADGAGDEDTCLGSVPWTSPEQTATPATADVRSDVYSLGAVLFDALTGTMPFDVGGDLASVLHTIRTVDAQPLRALRPDADHELEAILATCLQKDPDRRYGTAGELAQDLQRWLAGAPLQVLVGRPGYRWRKFVARHRLPVALAATLLLSLLVGGGVSTWLWQRSRHEQERLRRADYGHRVLLAAHALDDDNTDRARDLLAACPEDLRGFEWRRLLWQCDRSLVAVPVARRALCVAASSDGAWFAAGDADGNLVVVDTIAGGRRWHWRTDTPATALAFAPDGSRLFAHDDGALRTFRLDEGSAESVTTTGHRGAVHLALHPRGDLVAIADRSTDITVRDLPGGTVRWRRSALAHPARPRAIAWTPDGRHLAVAEGDALVLCGVDDGVERSRVRTAGDTTHLAFLPDGAQFVRSGSDGTLALHAADGRCLATRRPHGTWVEALAVADDGLTLLTAGADHTVKLWDAASLTLRTTLRGHRGSVVAAAFCGDRDRVVSGALDATLRLWHRDTIDDALVRTGHRDQIWSVAVAPDGRTVATASADGTLRLWPVADPRVEPRIVQPGGPLSAVAWSPDARLLATARIADGDGPTTVLVLDAETGGERRRATLPGPRCAAVAFAPDGRDVHAVDVQGNVLRLDVHGAQEPRRHALGSAVLAAALAPDGEALALGHLDGRLAVWSVRAEAVVREQRLHQGQVFGVAWAPDGRRLASAGYDGIVRVLDAATGAEITSLRGHRNGVRTVAFHPHEDRIATGGWDGTARLWHGSSGALVLTLRGHENRVEALAFDPAGQRLATVGLDHTLRVFDSAVEPTLPTPPATTSPR